MAGVDWGQPLGTKPDVLPDVPDTYAELFLSDPTWDGPIWIERHQRRFRLRYELPYGLGERNELHVDRRQAAAREAAIVDAIRRGTFVDRAFRFCDAVEFAYMLALTAPSPRAHRPLNDTGRQVRTGWIARQFMPLADDLTVEAMVANAVNIDRSLDDEEYALTSRAVSRHHFRWVLRQLIDLGLAGGHVLRALPTIPTTHGDREVPEEVDYDAVMLRLSPLERLAVDVIEETLCRAGELEGLDIRDWRPDLGVLAVRAHRQQRSRTKTGAVATYVMPDELADLLDTAVAGRTAGPLLIDENGRHITDAVLAGRLAVAAAEVGSLPLTPSDLRMIGASRRLAAGEDPDDIKRRLRHCGITTGERFYLRHVPGRDRVVVDSLDAALGGLARALNEAA